MKVKVFKVRLNDQFLYADQDMLDRFLQDHSIIKYETAFVRDEESYWSVIIYYEDIHLTLNEAKSSGKYQAEHDKNLTSDEVKILESLKLWRSEKAKMQKLPVYFIATNRELLSIAKYRPAKKEELQDIKGFGRHKIENYGEEIIGILEMI